MNILFTSAGRRDYLVKYFKETLNQQGNIHVANSSSCSTAMLSGNYSILTPLIHDKAYIPFLKAYCKEHKIRALVPLIDIDLPILSNYKDEFKEIGVELIVSEPEVIEICNDKWKTYEYLSDNGFYTPNTFLTLTDAIEAIGYGVVHFPLIIKPRWGMGSISIFEADNLDELEIFYNKVKRNIHATYLSYESQQDYDNCVIIQDKLVGQEYGLDIINDLAGNYQSTNVKKKHFMRAGETDCAEVVSHPALEQMGEQIGHILGHVANLDVDAFIVDGVPYVLEMNARFGGGYPFSHLSGVNLPKAIIHWLQDEAVESSLIEGKAGVIGYKAIRIIEQRTTEVPLDVS